MDRVLPFKDPVQVANHIRHGKGAEKNLPFGRRYDRHPAVTDVPHGHDGSGQPVCQNLLLTFGSKEFLLVRSLETVGLVEWHDNDVATFMIDVSYPV